MSAKPSYQVKRFLNALEQSEHGRVALHLPDGVRREFGEGQLLCEGKVHRWDVLEAILRRGDIGFAESYIDGSFELDRPDQMIAWACRNESQLKRAIYGTTLALVIDRLRHFGRRNTQLQAKKNISSHYDLGNEFYRLWLDRTLTYSSALFTSPEQSLESAQIAKYDRILDQAGVQPGDHILEIGCGWGGFLSHAARTRGARLTSITISQKQYETCLARVREEGLEDQVDVVLEDYRNIAGRFDHVVSIEMIEAVGAQYWPTYFDKIRSCLKPDGKAVIQAITIREDLFEAYQRGTDFIQQYVFPGGMLPTESTFDRLRTPHGLAVVDRFSFASSYERTLREWKERFCDVAQDIAALGFSEEFRRLWEFYLAYCEGAFRIGRIGVSHVTLQAVSR